MNKPTSLIGMLEEVKWVIDYAYTFARLRKSEADYHIKRMRDVERLIEWFMANEGDIRSFVDQRKAQKIVDEIHKGATA